jgi:transcriptional repressor NrdR
MVLARLKECDIVAYIRFASIYRDFQDIDSFTAELKSLSKRPRKKLSQVTEDK